MGLQEAVYTAVTMPINVIHKTSVGAASYAWNAATSVSLRHVYPRSLDRSYAELTPRLLDPSFLALGDVFYLFFFIVYLHVRIYVLKLNRKIPVSLIRLNLISD